MQLSQFTNSVRVTCFLTDKKSYIHNQQCAEDRDGMHYYNSSLTFYINLLFFHFSSVIYPKASIIEKDGQRHCR